MNDKKGPAVAWVCAVLAALLSLLVAASAARTVHAANGTFDGRHAAPIDSDAGHAQVQTPQRNVPSQP